jgi:SAM-dependent methyltransferase
MSAETVDSCVVCASPAVVPTSLGGPDRLLGTPGEFSVVRCLTCGAGRTLPSVTEADLAGFYPSQYHAHTEGEGTAYGAAWRLGQALRWRAVFRRWPLSLLARREPGSALDVGCGRGDLGAELIARGWEVAGVDPSPGAVELARRRGLDAHVGTVDALDSAEQQFDAVTMIHALEHVVDPLRDLAAVHALLAPGGTLVVEVPNFDSWQRRRMGSRWFHLDLPRHRTHFTPEALRRAAEATGFEAVEVRDGSDPGALLGTLQYRFFGHVVLGSGWGGAAWAASSLVLAPVMRLLDRVAGGRDFLHMVARKPG